MHAFALSIRQPWASLIVGAGALPAHPLGLKDVENRSWTTSYRGPLLIHAAARRIDRHADLGGLWTPDDIEHLPRGGIIGVVDLVDVVDRSDNPWFTGPLGWILRNARRLPFEPCGGRLGLFRVTPQQTATRTHLARYRLPF